MIEDPVRQRFFQKVNKKYFTSSNTDTHDGIYLVANWLSQSHEKILEHFLEN